MKPKRIAALAFSAIFLFILVVSWTHTGADFSDGDRAVANVAKLRKGMTLNEALHALHPERMARANGLSYSMRPTSTGGYATHHALTRDRFVQLISAPARKGARSGEATLTRWTLGEGPPPTEDVTIGRALQAGPFRFYY